MKNIALALVTLASSPFAGGGSPLVLDIPQDTYDVGQSISIHMTGGPDAGHYFWLMDLTPGPKNFAGVGLLDVGGTGVMQVIPLPPLGSNSYDFSCGPFDCDFPLLNTKIYMQLVAFDPQGSASISNPDCLLVDDSGKCELTGCTPGYWKNHTEAWGPTGYAPGDDYDTVFGVDVFDPDVTLLEALKPPHLLHQLEIHSVAALLNASHPDETYPYAAHVVIGLVKDAWIVGDNQNSLKLKDTLDMFNNENCTF